MKNLKKLMAVLLTVVMTMGLMTNAFAANGAGASKDHTITINFADATGKHTYKAYQVFAGEYENGKLSDITWGAGVNESALLADLVELDAYKDCKTAADVAAVLGAEGTEEVKAAMADQFAAIVSQHLNTVADTSSTEDGKAYTITVTGDGYYLVKDQDGTVPNNDAATKYILKVVGDVSVKAKASVPESDKAILEDGQQKNVNEKSIGDVITYAITGTLPKNYADYTYYYYQFNDTMSKGLTYKDDAKVYLFENSDKANEAKEKNKFDSTTGATELNGVFNIQSATNADKTTAISITCKDLKAVTGYTFNENSVIVVVYTATLNENAAIGSTTGNPNEVDLTFSNDPNSKVDPKTETEKHPTGKTPTHTVITYTTEITIFKVDENRNPLTGAEFTLTGNGVNIVLVTEEVFTPDENGTYYKLTDGTYTKEAPIMEDYTDNNGVVHKANAGDYESTSQTYVTETKTVAKGTGKNQTSVVGRVNDQGVVTFTGLGAGDYTITETTTPAGYNTIQDIKFTVEFDKDGANGKLFTVKPEKSENVFFDMDNNTFGITIENKSGSTLPETGGMGTTLLYAVGGVLVVGAGILLITKKRMGGVM